MPCSGENISISGCKTALKDGEKDPISTANPAATIMYQAPFPSSLLHLSELVFSSVECGSPLLRSVWRQTEMNNGQCFGTWRALPSWFLS